MSNQFRQKSRGDPVNSLEYILISPHSLELVEKNLEWPPVSGNGLLCKTLITGISTGTELAAWGGENPLRPSGGYPRKIGYQNISEVLAVFGKNEKIQIGDQIYTNQSHCSHFLSREEDVLAIVPKIGDNEKYIFSYMYHMSLCALSVDKRNNPETEMKIVVFGGGLLGSAIVEIANNLGHLVVLVSDSINESKISSPRITVMSREEFKEKYHETSGVFHQSVVCTNRWDDYNLALSSAGPNGTIVLLGFPGRDGSLPSQNPFEPKYFYANNLVISSLPMERRSLFSRSHKNLSLGESMLDIVNRISEGTLGQTFSTTKIFDYLDLESAYTELSEDRKSHGSVALRWSQN